MNTDLMNVAAFENETPDASFAILNPADESLADGIGSSYGIVGYRGKVWSLRLRGETHTFTRPDDGSPAAFLDVIILRSAGYKSKSYYPAGSFDQDNSGGRPLCAALDGNTPDSGIAEPQAAACAICPRNEWKTDSNGRKGRDCSDYKRLAVLILPSQTKALLGSPLMEPVFLRVPAASLNDLAILGEAMTKKGFHYSSYITRIGFQLDKAHPQMTFRALQKLTSTEAPIVLPMREDPQAMRITGESEVGKHKMLASTSTTKSVAQTHTQSSQHNTSAPQTNTSTPAPSAASSPKTSTTSTSSTSAQGTSTPEDDEEAALLKQLAAAKARKAEVAAAKAAETAKLDAAAEKVDAGFGGLSGQIIEPTKTTTKPTQVEGLGSTQSTVEVVDTGFGASAGETVAAATTAGMANTIADTGPADEADDDLDARVAGLLGK